MSIPVTVDTFARAETDHYLRSVSPMGLGVLAHRREPAAVEHQDVIRMNRDTLYSIAVLDLDAGPATFTLPDPGDRFQSLLIIDQDHYTQGGIYGPATVTITRESIGTRYAAAIVRTFVDADDPDDRARTHALQDAVVLEAPAGGSLELPDWDEATLAIVRETLLRVGADKLVGSRTFGTREEVDPIAHLIGTAGGWGGNPTKDSAYEAVFPELNDGTTAHTLTVGDVPVDGFWSVSVYSADGYFVPNDSGRYSVNNVTAEKNADGTVTISLGGDGPNPIPVPAGWNYVVRLYRPRAEILEGGWTFPVATPVT